MTPSARNISLCAIAAILATTPLVARVPNPHASILLAQLHESAHTLLFFIVHLLILFTVGKLLRQRRRSVAAVLMTVGALSFVLGFLIEVIQANIGRDSSWGDIYRNCLGIIAASGTALTVVPEIKSLAVRLLGAFVAVGALLTAAAPVASWGYAQLLRDQAFPSLMDFEVPHTNRYASAVAGADLAIVPAPEQWQHNTGRVALITMPKQLRFPGMLLRNPQADWQSYSILSFEVYSPNAQPILMAVNIHSAEHGRRPLLHRPFTVLPGLHHYQLELGPSETMAGQHITDLLLHSLQPDRNKAIYLDNLQLQ